MSIKRDEAIQSINEAREKIISVKKKLEEKNNEIHRMQEHNVRGTMRPIRPMEPMRPMRLLHPMIPRMPRGGCSRLSLAKSISCNKQ